MKRQPQQCRSIVTTCGPLSKRSGPRNASQSSRNSNLSLTASRRRYKRRPLTGSWPSSSGRSGHRRLTVSSYSCVVNTPLIIPNHSGPKELPGSELSEKKRFLKVIQVRSISPCRIDGHNFNYLSSVITLTRTWRPYMARSGRSWPRRLARHSELAITSSRA